MLTMGSGTALAVRPRNHFAHSRRRIENNEMTLVTIAGSLLRIFVRMEKLGTHRSGI